MAESPADGAETALVVVVSERPSMALGLGSSLRTISLGSYTYVWRRRARARGVPFPLRPLRALSAVQLAIKKRYITCTSYMSVA